MQIALNVNALEFGFLCADFKKWFNEGKNLEDLGRVLCFSRNRKAAPLGIAFLLHFPVPQSLRLSDAWLPPDPAQLGVFRTLRAGDGVLRPGAEPPLSVHLALPAPLVSEVVYVKIKPLETQACLLLLCEDPRLLEDWRPAPPCAPGGAAAGSAGAGRTQPRPWRQFRLWIRQWPADPRAPSRSP